MILAGFTTTYKFIKLLSTVHKIPFDIRLFSQSILYYYYNCRKLVVGSVQTWIFNVEGMNADH